MAYEKLQEHIRAFFKDGERFAHIFGKLKGNSKAICVPCISRVLLDVSKSNLELYHIFVELFKFDSLHWGVLGKHIF